MVPIEMTYLHSYSTSIHTGLSFTGWLLGLATLHNAVDRQTSREWAFDWHNSRSPDSPLTPQMGDSTKLPFKLQLNVPVQHIFVQYLITFCSRPETDNDVISGRFVGPIVPDRPAKFRDPRSNLSREIPSEAVVCVQKMVKTVTFSWCPNFSLLSWQPQLVWFTGTLKLFCRAYTCKFASDLRTSLANFA